MPAIYLRDALALISDGTPLEIKLEIREGANSFAALDYDLKALNALLFIAGVAEFVSVYIAYRAADLPNPVYSLAAFDDFTREFITPRRQHYFSWVDVVEKDSDLFRSVFDGWIRNRRNPGTGIAATSETVRLELVEIYKQNPTITKVIAIGSIVSITALGGIVIGANTYITHGAEECRKKHHELNIQATDRILENVKRTGKPPTPLDGQMYSDATQLTAMAFAACKPDLVGLNVRFKFGDKEMAFGLPIIPKTT
jgi:hypothetical protein